MGTCHSKRNFKEIIAFTFIYAGLYFFLQKVFGEKKVPIIVYHAPSPKVFVGMRGIHGSRWA